VLPEKASAKTRLTSDQAPNLAALGFQLFSSVMARIQSPTRCAYCRVDGLSGPVAAAPRTNIRRDPAQRTAIWGKVIRCTQPPQLHLLLLPATIFPNQCYALPIDDGNGAGLVQVESHPASAEASMHWWFGFLL
jgi:hypothetical protein